MGSPVVTLDDLGARVARALDAGAAEREIAIDVARRKFLDAATSPKVGVRSAVNLRSFGFGAAAFAAAACVALFFGFREPSALEFTADGEPGALQTWLSAPKERPMALRFSDGTKWRVEPSSRMRVVDASADGASVTLENGALHADVVHTGHGAWRVIAGPLTVRVTGTRFDVRWSTVSEEFLIAVTEGSVEVSGSVVGAERPVRAGETLRVSVNERRLELTKGPVATEASAPAVAVRERSPVEERELSPESEPSAGETARNGDDAAPPLRKRAPASDWRELARSGALRRSFAAAEAGGFDKALSVATAAELLLLGDGARLAGRPDRASEALLSLRRRFPGDSRRAGAAFALGKVAFDQTHSYGQAADWFGTCVREQPGGSLAREASGRRIEALERAGRSSEAKSAAQSYLARYPNGPHADVARSALEE